MSDSVLRQIQALQFTDKSKAERLLAEFLQAAFGFSVLDLTLQPKPVSLNSFNGVITLDEGAQTVQRFFKTHVESDDVIDEYYNADVLAKAGYPVIQPIFSSSRAGQQFLMYDLIAYPTVFDHAWAIERDTTLAMEPLAAAQALSDDQLLAIYTATLAHQNAADHAKQPIHQLFYHRLTGGRLDRFYGGSVVADMPGDSLRMAELRQMRWRINDRSYAVTLDDQIAAAITLLHPDNAGASIIGHGDAHNGNIFFRGADQPILYFDPAFAGRHDPLLDLVKPIFHNVFAMWMYFPMHIAADQPITWMSDGETCIVTYDERLHPVRQMFLNSKIDRVLVPTLRLLRDYGWLPEDWRQRMKLRFSAAHS